MWLTILRVAIVICAAFLVTGCATTAGPFVTNISSDGRGGLVIEKAMVEYSQWSEGITTKDHTTTTIYIGTVPTQPSAGNTPTQTSESD